MRRGLIIILSSPSGAGKSTLSDRLRAWDKDIVFSISATTREPRDGEKDGREYFFKSREDFLKMVDNQDVIKNRMALARDEISHWPEYDYVLINNDLDKTENDLKTIIKAERLKLSQQPKIVDDVRNLNNEFESR